MGMCSPPLQECSEPPIRFMAMLFPAPYGVGIILSANEKNVNPQGFTARVAQKVGMLWSRRFPWPLVSSKTSVRIKPALS